MQPIKSICLFTVAVLCNPFANVMGQDTGPNETNGATARSEPLDEVIITAPGPRQDLLVRPGWRPESAQEAHQHLKNAYALLTELERLAKKCNVDAIVTYGDKLRQRPCEEFLDLHDSRALTNYNIQCEGLVEWYREQVEQFQSDPEWQKDQDALRGFSFFKQNIILACDMKTVQNNFKYLHTARVEAAKIRDYVANARNPPIGVGGFNPINGQRAAEAENAGE